jgi:hypothetical protein
MEITYAHMCKYLSRFMEITYTHIYVHETKAYSLTFKFGGLKESTSPSSSNALLALSTVVTAFHARKKTLQN